MNAVNTGLVEDWNQRQSGESKVVQRGDRIISVNGVSGDVRSLIPEVQTAQTLNLTVRRATNFSLFRFKPAQLCGENPFTFGLACYLVLNPIYTASLVLCSDADGGGSSEAPAWKDSALEPEIRHLNTIDDGCSMDI